MNTITIDQFKYIINKFTLTTNIKYKFELTKKSQKPSCFHKELNLITLGDGSYSSSYLTCKTCGYDFVEYNNEGVLRKELNSKEIQSKKNFIKEKNKNINLNLLNKKKLNELYETTFKEDPSLYLYTFQLYNPHPIKFPRKQVICFLKHLLSEKKNQEFNEFIINIFKHIITTQSKNWTNTSFEDAIDLLKKMFKEMKLDATRENVIIKKIKLNRANGKVNLIMLIQLKIC